MILTFIFISNLCLVMSLLLGHHGQVPAQAMQTKTQKGAPCEESQRPSLGSFARCTLDLHDLIDLHDLGSALAISLHDLGSALAISLHDLDSLLGLHLFIIPLALFFILRHVDLLPKGQHTWQVRVLLVHEKHHSDACPCMNTLDLHVLVDDFREAIFNLGI